jgi:PhzF family phenazine biosynthesis protein
MTTEVLRYSAFTRDGTGGNPAGVVLNAHCLDEAQMLSIAEAIGYSETAFVLPDDSDPRRTRLRYFSPKAEVAFCGHATIATAVALAHQTGPGELLLTTMAGPISVVTRGQGESITATLTSPPAHSRAADESSLGRALAAFGWTAADLAVAYPPHVAFAGNHHLMLGLRSEELLADLAYDYDALATVMAEQSWTTVNAFWAESASTFHARNPFPPGGVVEDPATGAAAAAFGGYLRAIGHDGVPGRVVVLQGHHMGAPSRLLVDVDPGSPGVRVTGTATRLALSPYDEIDSA